MMAAQGKCFVLRSRLNGLVLDVSSNSTSPRTPVIMFHPKPRGANANQLWYEDHITGTIRTQLNGFCMDLIDNHLVINPYMPGNYYQRWMLSGNKVQHRDNPSLVLDIEAQNPSPQARIVSWTFRGSPNQLWDAQYEEPQYFYIKSAMNDFALDVKNGENRRGADVIMWPCKMDGSANQLWFENSHGVICSKMNGFALDSSSGRLKLEPFRPNNRKQQWVLAGDRIHMRHNPNQVLDIVAANSSPGAELCQYKFSGNRNQLWRIQYA